MTVGLEANACLQCALVFKGGWQRLGLSQLYDSNGSTADG